MVAASTLAGRPPVSVMSDLPIAACQPPGAMAEDAAGGEPTAARGVAVEQAAHDLAGGRTARESSPRPGRSTRAPSVDVQAAEGEGHPAADREGVERAECRAAAPSWTSAGSIPTVPAAVLSRRIDKHVGANRRVEPAGHGLLRGRGDRSRARRPGRRWCLPCATVTSPALSYSSARRSGRVFASNSWNARPPGLGQDVAAVAGVGEVAEVGAFVDEAASFQVDHQARAGSRCGCRCW